MAFKKFIYILLFILFVISTITAAYSIYIYSYPEMYSKELYALKQEEYAREKESESFAMALEEFYRQTRASGGKAVMAMLNVPRNAPPTLAEQEFDVKSQFLPVIIVAVTSAICSLLGIIFVRKQIKNWQGNYRI